MANATAPTTPVICPGCANRVSPMERLLGACAKSGQRY